MGEVIRGRFPTARSHQKTTLKKGDTLLEKRGKRDTGSSGQSWRVLGSLNIWWVSRGRGRIFFLRKEDKWTLRDVLTVRFVSQRRLSEMLTAGRYEKLVPIMPLRKKVGMPGR